MIILVFVMGVGLSFIGSLPLGMINLTVADLAMHRGMQAALRFALGAALVEGVQSFIAVQFSHLFLSGSLISTIINWLAVVIFIGLGIFFLFRKPTFSAHAKQNVHRAFIQGMGVSALNVMVYPYWILYSSWMVTNKLMNESLYHGVVFSAGIVLGGFLLFYLYARFAVWMTTQSAALMHWSRYIFAAIFITLGVVQLVRLLLK